jgi:hypothetical protein
VVEVNRAREAIDLAEALKHGHAMPGSAEHRRERLSDRAVTDDRDVEVEFL